MIDQVTKRGRPAGNAGRGRPKTIPDAVHVTIALHPDTIRALDYIRTRTGVNRCEIIRRAIDAYLNGGVDGGR